MTRRLAPFLCLAAFAVGAQTYIGPVGKSTPGAATVQGSPNPSVIPVTVTCPDGTCAPVFFDGGTLNGNVNVINDGGHPVPVSCPDGTTSCFGGGGGGGGGGGNVVVVNDGGNPVPVTGTFTATIGAVSIDGGYLTVGIADGGHVIADQGAAGAPWPVVITDAGPLAVTQATAANLKAQIVGPGTAGAQAGGVLTVQGDPSGTPLPISGSTTVSGTVTVDQGTSPWVSNTSQIAGTTTATGNGTTNAGTQRVTISSDSTGQVALAAGSAIIGKVGIDQTTPGTTNGVVVNAALPAGTNLLGNVGIDQTTPGTTNGVQVNAALPAGTNLLGKVGIDQTTAGTTNAVSTAYIGANAVAAGNGTTSTGTQRVTISSDSTGQIALAAGSANIGAVAIQSGQTLGLVAGSAIVGSAKITDGTNTATVKAASTPAATTDTAIVVSERPTATPVCTSFIAINQTSGTTVITGTASQYIYICSIVLISAIAQNVSLIEGTGTVCASGTPIGVLGGTTASMPFAATGGLTLAAGVPFFKGRTAADNFCVVQSGSGNVSGGIFYVSGP